MIVATSERHAARAGVAAMLAGGNAIDGAIAAAAALTVTEPTSNGLGGDLFALVWQRGEIFALGSAGRSPAALTRDRVPAGGMPLTGWLPVTVPGQVAGWGELSDRLGRLPLGETLAPAIALARGGFEVGPVTAAAWKRAAPRFEELEEWNRVFGSVPAAGDRFANPDLADSLEVIARGGARAFYSELGQEIADWAAESGGLLTAADLAAHRAEWVQPLSAAYRGWRVVGMTAPTQGVVALEALGVLGPLPVDPHYQIEAVKLAFADAHAAVADPAHMAIDPRALLSRSFLAERRALIGDLPLPSPAPVGLWGGTVLVCTSDDEGRLVSLIQSNFHGFGSGIVVPGTGIALQNRGAGFSMVRGHPNEVGPGKQPFHTILPGLILEGSRGAAAFGCMGGQMQPQGHVQLVSHLWSGVQPQDACDRPRWRLLDSGQVALERGFDAEIAADLEQRGHRLVPDGEPRGFGGAQIVMADGRAGSDRRKDGCVARG